MTMKNEQDSEQPAIPPLPPATGSAAVERPRPSIEELERMLASNEPLDIEIQPDGSIRAVPKGTANNAEVKPITAKYAAAEYY